MKHFTHTPPLEKSSFVKKFQNNNPTTKQEIKALGFKVRHAGSGAFRDVYILKGTGLVVKIPQDSWSTVDHSQNELKWYVKIMTTKKYKVLKNYMPEIYYYDYENGVILMKEYAQFFNDKRLKDFWNKVSSLGEVFNDLFNQLLCKKREWRDFDNSGNIGWDASNSKLVVLDLGCFDGS